MAASSSSAISVAKEGDGVAIVTFAKEPVNTMDLSFWKELLVVLESLEADKEIRGLVFQSGLKRSVYTAGLDIKELYRHTTSQERQLEFWTAMSKALIKIYSTPMVTAAAIKGACPAGGCGLALCCDYRVISEDGSMGLNESQLGILVPPYWTELFASVVGNHRAELLLEPGDLVPAARLVPTGLADAVVPSAGDVLPAALAEVRRWLKVPDGGRVKTKQLLRGRLAERWAAGIEEEAAIIWAATCDPVATASLAKVMERLSGKPAPKAKL